MIVKRKLFAKRDYEGLTEAGKTAKKEVRDRLAKSIKANRRIADREIESASIPESTKEVMKKEIRKRFKGIHDHGEDTKFLKSIDNKSFDELGKYNKTSKNLRKIGVGVGAGLALAGTGAYLAKKHYDKKKSEKKD